MEGGDEYLWVRAVRGARGARGATRAATYMKVSMRR
jgi:hypothetical protein